MGAAAYVGRVGGLAVALGIGSAIFAGHGVAWAEETGSSPSKTTASATSASDKSDRDTSASDKSDTADSSATAEEADADEPEAEPEDEAEEPAAEAEPEAEADPDPEPDPEAEADPQPDDTGEPEPEDEAAPEPEPEPDDTDEPEPETPSKPTTSNRTPTFTEDTSTAEKTTTPTATKPKPAETSDDPAVAPQKPTKVAVFASADTLATANSTTVSPRVSALLSTPTTTQQPPKPNIVTAVVNVVNSMLDWARQKADPTPGSAPQPPFMWALMSFARRELENLFVSRTTTTAARTTAVAPTSLALADDQTAVTAAALVPYSPWLNPQVSPSTNFVSWVTGKYVYGDKTLANTYNRFQVHGTDVGVMWDNGMVDDPSTPDINEHQVLIAVGDTFGSANMTGRWIYNTLFRSSDDDLSDGMTIPDGEWFNGNMFGGAPLSGPTQARPIIDRPSWAPNSVTLIPTAGVSLPTEVTEDTPFGTIQYVSFMSVSKWGTAGRWTTNYSAIAYSTDNGENFTVARGSVRYNSFFSSNRNFQQSAFVMGDDGYVFMYGTPNGRQGAAYLARVAPDDILNVSRYEYYKAASTGWFRTTPAKWVVGNPRSASAIIGKSGSRTQPGYTVSEMSVQYNEYLQKYIVLYGDQNNSIVMRTADTPEGAWSEATVLMRQQTGGIYAPMMHPWSPSTLGTGTDLYWNLSLWSDYNIMLMRTDLTQL
ncbi:DUF4185 domain-containing protein [Mycolicibacterium pyrenivorans]|uniref:DUF4185 domain-containing protein n=1 Tax=Mycolicibacterium pyrenivorans TaxID=187102 RepID=UPI0021F29F60|nr:DUF4185 domain-containing protein [Mycolicibacterium pyrenivorans]MCV7152767.1 DUF4185 domain-containing protein [Mycolicibacterium pyrenivorans]